MLTGLAFKGDVVTTGQTAQSMCFATSLSTAKKILDTGLIPVELFTNSQVNNWFCPSSALLRSLQIYWSGLTDTLDVQEPWTGEALPGISSSPPSLPPSLPQSGFVEVDDVWRRNDSQEKISTDVVTSAMEKYGLKLDRPDICMDHELSA
eukprot:symbB.v1.2.021611.t1/scaffold1857.1/size167749/1